VTSRRVVSVHEAGHAIVAAALSLRVRCIEIFRPGSSAASGRTTLVGFLTLPQGEWRHESRRREYLLAHVAVFAAGQVAECLDSGVCGAMTDGACLCPPAQLWSKPFCEDRNISTRYLAEIGLVLDDELPAQVSAARRVLRANRVAHERLTQALERLPAEGGKLAGEDVLAVIGDSLQLTDVRPWPEPA
jgi:hypothetical protein